VARVIDPRKYDGIENQVSRILPNDIYKKIKRNFIRSIRDIMKRSVSMQDNQGRTPLHIAASKGDYNSVKLFIKLGGNKDLVDSNGRTPLQQASKKIVMRYLSSLEETV